MASTMSEYELEGEEFLGTIGRIAGSLLGGQGEYEGEFEEEWEGEVNPIRRIYPDALMEHLGHIAAEAESEAEAEAFCAVLVPLALRVYPRAIPAVIRTAPQLIQG